MEMSILFQTILLCILGHHRYTDSLYSDDTYPLSSRSGKPVLLSLGDRGSPLSSLHHAYRLDEKACRESKCQNMIIKLARKQTNKLATSTAPYKPTLTTSINHSKPRIVYLTNQSMENFVFGYCQHKLIVKVTVRQGQRTEVYKASNGSTQRAHHQINKFIISWAIVKHTHTHTHTNTHLRNTRFDLMQPVANQCMLTKIIILLLYICLS